MSTPNATPEHLAQEQVLTEFRTWMLTLTPERLDLLGIDMSVEEPMRLLRGFAADKGLTLG